MATTPAPISFENLQKGVLDGSISEAEVRSYLKELPPSEGTLEPQLVFNPEFVELPEEQRHVESALAMNTANAWCYQMRRIAYLRKKQSPGGDKLIRIVSEGDSWFQYPFLLKDVIDHVSDRPDVAVRDFSAAGDILSRMVGKPQFLEAIQSEKPHYFLISGGGNDLVDGRGLRDLLKKFDPSLKPADYLNTDNFKAYKARMLRLYSDLFSMVHQEDKNIHIICHGYAYAIPNSKRGPWLGKPLEENGVTDRALQLEIVKKVVDVINDAMESTAAAHKAGKVSYVNNRGTIPIKDECWHDEFHPTSEWFGKVTEPIKALIK